LCGDSSLTIFQLLPCTRIHLTGYVDSFLGTVIASVSSDSFEENEYEHTSIKALEPTPNMFREGRSETHILASEILINVWVLETGHVHDGEDDIIWNSLHSVREQ
jgi:hypothetical protein